jgi:hypothetical protein
MTMRAPLEPIENERFYWLDTLPIIYVEVIQEQQLIAVCNTIQFLTSQDCLVKDDLRRMAMT